MTTLAVELLAQSTCVGSSANIFQKKSSANRQRLTGPNPRLLYVVLLLAFSHTQKKRGSTREENIIDLGI